MQSSNSYNRNAVQPHLSSYHNPSSGYAATVNPHAAQAYHHPTSVVSTTYTGSQSSESARSVPYSDHAHHPTAVGGDPGRGYYVQSNGGNGAPSTSVYSSTYSPPATYNQSQYNNMPDARLGPHNTHSQQFIPTPSQTYQVYSNSSTTASRRPGASMEGCHDHPSAVPSQHGQPAKASSTSSPTSAAGERFPCEYCDRTFSRSHDRRRHYETHHAPTPTLHRCRYCGKDFSRSDSLKRHVDNGCDEMPART